MADLDNDAGSGGGAGGPAAVGAALANASREKADAFLEEQTILARLQAEDLRREDSVRHWSLRVRHISDVMKLAFELAIALIVLAIAAALAAAFWSASHEDGVVIEAMSVPPDMAARGLTGQVVSAQLEDKLAAMQNATDSARPPDSYSSNWGDDIKVEIPNTGISIGEAYRYLAGWLGHQTHITGEVYRTSNGIAVTARAGQDGSTSVTGAESDLDKLLQQTAEQLYRRTQPYRYAVFIEKQNRFKEARAVFEALEASPSLHERAWAYGGVAQLDTPEFSVRRSIKDYDEALKLWPQFALAWINLDNQEGLLGHDEAQFDAAKNAVRLIQSGADVGMTPRAEAISLLVEQGTISFDQDDFPAARSFSERVALMPNYGNNVENARQQLVIEDAMMHDVAAAKQAESDLPPPKTDQERSSYANNFAFADYFIGDWKKSLAETPEAEALSVKSAKEGGASDAVIQTIFSCQIWPFVADSKAETGDFKGADALIAKTPLDCDTCVRMRGNVASLKRKWSEAERWYALAIAEAPSIPLNYSDFGRMLLTKGDDGRAIAEFSLAHEKGPHFADPLEMWGEALMAENRSDLARAKFEEANRYAPHWGRLHLKWAEALLWTGRKDDAMKQFSGAASLALSPSERAELARVRASRQSP